MKREIDFVKFNPTQNMTILIEDDNVVQDYEKIATKIMAYDSVYGEQVGFVKTPLNKKASALLRMAGGEFCGNACMALGTLKAFEQELDIDEKVDIVLEVSGTDSLIVCQVRRTAHKYCCQLNMPIPTTLEQTTLHYEGSELSVTFVIYREAIHLIINVDGITDSLKDKAESLARLLGGNLNTHLIGVLMYNPISNELAPLIYVPHLDSMMWERGCGSGTASIGAYLTWKNKRKTVAEISQPGGTITVSGNYLAGEIRHLNIEGSVELVAKGTAYIDV
ncbi:diaminopimelate epimerase [Salipaludibacillus sp. LMS25]|uniref:diaminopimelate epimerase n=1 Tax=Salipaludibacillus sp. LMS25 TaxID=2924031 RepID=UPI0020D1C869|nr:diaminopimelate epimerase [Salipaludibacillus sp. LMS25]UTR16863.1 diaminopimelate epimerase [Salipaludibacillus sp. LMS25]